MEFAILWCFSEAIKPKKLQHLYILNICGKFHVDEIVIKCDGEYKWFWGIIDADTKFLVATHLSVERTIEEVIIISC